mmetsp:Transcript_21059/g.50767  ORF Transcript_21059/g.50767 Transcript_21059/m.50767 type:complete len:111 (+) Transcript_21059:38-370(+)
MAPSPLLRCFVLLVCGMVMAIATLPPGYEDELYCPEGSCLGKKTVPDAWSGPRMALFECKAEDGQGKASAPRPWGSQIDAAVKEKYLAEGLHTRVCAAEAAPTADGSKEM